MADAPVWSDARTFRGRPWRGLVDGLIGGIPCQPHSKSGKMLGAEDERDLWPDGRRTIVQSGAWVVLIENVEGMLSTGGAERVVRDLERLGFTVEIGLFSAAEVGAPHGRLRVFILAVHEKRLADAGSTRWGAGRTGGQAADAGGGGARGAEGHQPGPRSRALDTGAGELLADCHRERSPKPVRPGGDAGEERAPIAGDRGAVGDTFGGLRDGRPAEPRPGSHRRTAPERAGPPALFPPGPDDLDGWREVLAARPDLEPSVHRMADGLADRVERIRLHGNGVVPLVAAYALRTLATRLAARAAGADRLVRMMEVGR